jgi:hypothetical protein
MIACRGRGIVFSALCRYGRPPEREAEVLAASKAK